MSIQPFLLAGALIIALSCTPAPASAGTVAFWDFEEEPVGDVASGTSSILDSSGNGLNGTPFGEPLYVADSAEVPGSGLGLEFKSSRIGVPDNALLQLTASLTLDAFIRIDG